MSNLSDSNAAHEYIIEMHTNPDDHQMHVHPKTGLHYFHVIPIARGPFMDVRGVYEYAATLHPWISVLSPHTFAILQATALYADPRACFVFWDSAIIPPPKRGAKIATVYAEAIGDANEMVKAHVDHLYLFFEYALQFDVIFCHTPWMAEHLAATYQWPTAVLPVGYAPTLGVPDKKALKKGNVAFYGSMIGNRVWSYTAFANIFGHQIADISGCYAEALTEELNHYKTVLYLAHSHVRSFSTWRAWQACASNAVLLAESGTHGWDSWPFEQGKHFIGFEMITRENAHQNADSLMDVIRVADFESIRKEMSKMRETFHISNVLEDYLVPATMRLAP